MEFKKDIEDLKQINKNNANAEQCQDDINIETQENESNEKLPTTFEDAKNKALAEFKPKYNHSKTMYENGKDIARTIGLSEALKDNEFIDEIADAAKEEIKTDIDTDKKNSEKQNQDAFYKKHSPVLKFARMKEPCDIHLMKCTFVIAVIPYILSMVIGEIFNLIIKCFEAVNDLFNAIIGVPEYLTNEETGELLRDNDGNLITKNVKVNLLTKIIFWFCFTMICLVIVLAIIRSLTGFDIVQALKNLING